MHECFDHQQAYGANPTHKLLWPGSCNFKRSSLTISVGNIGLVREVQNYCYPVHPERCSGDVASAAKTLILSDLSFTNTTCCVADTMINNIILPAYPKLTFKRGYY